MECRAKTEFSREKEKTKWIFEETDEWVSSLVNNFMYCNCWKRNQSRGDFVAWLTDSGGSNIRHTNFFLFRGHTHMTISLSGCTAQPKVSSIGGGLRRGGPANHAHWSSILSPSSEGESTLSFFGLFVCCWRLRRDRVFFFLFLFFWVFGCG
jgi:hypothetical protein